MLTATNYKYINFRTSKIACFINVDPLQFKYPYYTPYQYAGNKPISYIDLDGAEEKKENNEIPEIDFKTLTSFPGRRYPMVHIYGADENYFNKERRIQFFKVIDLPNGNSIGIYSKGRTFAYELAPVPKTSTTRNSGNIETVNNTSVVTPGQVQRSIINFTRPDRNGNSVFSNQAAANRVINNVITQYNRNTWTGVPNTIEYGSSSTEPPTISNAGLTSTVTTIEEVTEETIQNTSSATITISFDTSNNTPAWIDPILRNRFRAIQNALVAGGIPLANIQYNPTQNNYGVPVANMNGNVMETIFNLDSNITTTTTTQINTRTSTDVTQF